MFFGGDALRRRLGDGGGPSWFKFNPSEENFQCGHDQAFGARQKRGIFLKAYDQLKKIWDQFDAIAIGPGLGRDLGTQQFARQVIIHCPKPLVIDADALFALAGILIFCLKPRPAYFNAAFRGNVQIDRMSPSKNIEANRLKIARDFARKLQLCVIA